MSIRGYSMSTIWAFNNIENNHTLCGREDCMKKFCSSLSEHATNILNFEKKKILLLIKEEVKLHQDARKSCICGKIILQTLAKSKNYRKVRSHCHFIQVNIEAQHIVFVIQNFMCPMKSL